MSTFPRAAAPLDPSALRAPVDGDIVLPDDADWDAARLAWNLTVDQQPAMAALPESAADVAAVVAYAAENDLRVAVQGTGHGAAARGGELSGAILMKMERMRGIEIDAVNRTARVESGVVWAEVAEAAGASGLAALAGSSPDVGVVGYTLGGGLSWLAAATVWLFRTSSRSRSSPPTPSAGSMPSPTRPVLGDPRGGGSLAP
jgi:FAD/FMN-containing dehydrogenase